MSLRFKTVLGVALIEAFLLALLIGTVVSHQHRGAEQSLQKRAHTTATLFASTTKDPLLSLDLASLESFSQELMGNPDLVYVRVLDANGQPYAEAGDPALLATPFVADHVLDEVTDGVFDASANIMESDIVYGRVELGFDIHAITKELDDTLSLGVGIAVVEMLLVGLFSLLLGTYLTRQLRILRSTAKKISEGDYTTRIPVTGHDEVAEVSIAFNRMSIALHESQISRDKFEAQLIYIETYQTLLQKYQSAHQLPEDARLDAIAEIRKIEDKQDIEFINEDITELVNDSVDGTTRVRDIVQGLSDFSHMGAKNRALCNLNDCLESTLKIVKNGLKKQCSIETHLQSVPMVIANKGELNQILMNLLVNAGQAVDDGGCIRIESSQLTCDNGEYVQVTIEDNGSGIDPEHLDKLFDPFFTTKPVGEGTGMGLAISYGIIKDHDGEIAVESEPGVGTKFTIRLPIGTDAELQQAA